MKPAKAADHRRPWRTITENECIRLNLCERLWMVRDPRPAVVKTVCGALLRRPGWVRFPSIPANSCAGNSQDDSHSSRLRGHFVRLNLECVREGDPGLGTGDRGSNPHCLVAVAPRPSSDTLTGRSYLTLGPAEGKGES